MLRLSSTEAVKKKKKEKQKERKKERKKLASRKDNKVIMQHRCVAINDEGLINNPSEKNTVALYITVHYLAREIEAPVAPDDGYGYFSPVTSGDFFTWLHTCP
jgi:hypothetical protein